jgi:hypothetical protein
LIYQAEQEIATATRLIEGRDTTLTSTAGTRVYAFPTGVLDIKRVEYDGVKLEPIDFRDDDSVTLYDADTTARGTPLFYSVWNNNIYLRPIPDTSSLGITLYTYKEPLPVTTGTQTLEVPAIFHMSIVDFVVSEMAAKDQQFQTATYYRDKWDNVHMPRIKMWVQKRKKGDSFKSVKNIDDFTGNFGSL